MMSKESLMHVFKVYRYTSVLFLAIIISKRDNFCDFLFASLVKDTLPKGVYS